MITYVTGNYGKYIHVKNKFKKSNIDINYYKYDFIEPDINDIEYISKYKVKKAYEILKSPCFVTDSGFYIEDYPDNPNYPGAYVKRSNISNNIDKLLITMKNVKNRKCRFIDCLTYFDGKEFHTFYEISEGTLSHKKKGKYKKRAKSNLWYVFIPNGCNKTLSEMTDEEIDSITKEDAIEKFINWYKER